MAVAMITTAVQQTLAIDEPAYAGAAAVQWQQHSLRYNAEHPPPGSTSAWPPWSPAAPRLTRGYAITIYRR